jgi:hypothetical protein
MPRFLLCLVIGALLAGVVGCSSNAKVVPVSGTVTLDGKPLPNAHVAFQPVAEGASRNAGSGSFGATDAAGHYTLNLADSGEPGVAVGKHRVEISLKAASDDRDPKLRPPSKTLPERYNRRTELEFDVPAGGTDQANFDLKSK